MSDARVRGRFIWHELMTTDPAAALLLYPRVAGWDVRPSPEDPSYTLLARGGVLRAGVMRLPEEAAAMGAPPSWMSYIGTEDADATSRQAEALGGLVLRSPTDIPGTCRFAVLQDPQGAVFAVFQPLGEPMPDQSSERGDFAWHELATSDAAGAFQFYVSLFGWQATESMDMGPMGTYQMFGNGGPSLGGMYTVPRDLGVPSHWLPYARVDDSFRSSAAMEAGGGRVISAPMQIPTGDWVAKLVDPQGAVFAVHSLQADTSAPAPARSGEARAASPRRAASKPRPRAKVKPARKPAARPKARVKPARKAARPAPARKRSKRAAPKSAANRKAAKPARKATGARKKAGAKRTAARKPVRRKPRKAGRSASARKRSGGARSRRSR